MSLYKKLLIGSLFTFAPLVHIISLSANSPNSGNEHEAWFFIADHDLKAAQLLMEHNPELFDIALYHAQQCTEKILKAFLVFKDKGIPRTHNLIHLINLCKKIDPDFQTCVAAIAKINPFSTRLRYPHSPQVEPSINEAMQLMYMAQDIFYFVHNKIMSPSAALAFPH